MSTVIRLLSLAGVITALSFGSNFSLADKHGKDPAGDKATKLSEVSGYLGPEVYAMLEEVEIRDGRKSQRWLGPKLNFANYKRVLIEDVILFPEPQPGPQVSAETLDAVRAYLTEKLKEKVGEVLVLTEEPGPEVLRFELAITGVQISTEGMKAYEVVPVAAVFGGLKALTGSRDREVRVFIEGRMSDSVTGEMVGAGIREIQGENLKGKKDQLELEDMRENLDTATDDAHYTLTRMLQEQQQEAQQEQQ